MIKFRLWFRSHLRGEPEFTKVFSWPEAGNEHAQRYYANYYALKFGAYNVTEETCDTE